MYWGALGCVVAVAEYEDKKKKERMCPDAVLAFCRVLEVP